MTVEQVAQGIHDFGARVSMLFFQNCFKASLTSFLPFKDISYLYVLASQTILGAPNNYHCSFLISLFCRPSVSGAELARQICSDESPRSYGVLACLYMPSLNAFLLHFDLALRVMTASAPDSAPWDNLLTALRPWSLTYRVADGLDRYVDMMALMSEFQLWLSTLINRADATVAVAHQDIANVLEFKASFGDIIAEVAACKRAWEACRVFLSISAQCHGFSGFSGCSLFFPFGLHPLDGPVRHNEPWPYTTLAGTMGDLSLLFACVPALEHLFKVLSPTEERFKKAFESAAAHLLKAPALLPTVGPAAAWIPRWKQEKVPVDKSSASTAQKFESETG